MGILSSVEGCGGLPASRRVSPSAANALRVCGVLLGRLWFAIGWCLAFPRPCIHVGPCACVFFHELRRAVRRPTSDPISMEKGNSMIVKYSTVQELVKDKSVCLS